MRQLERLRRLTILVIIALLFSVVIGSAKPAGDSKTDNNDEIGTKIEEQGKSIDEIGSSIEKSTDGMEEEIENAGKGIDSPEAEKRIEIAGESIDELSDKMDRETEEKGREIEDAVKTKDSDDEKSTAAIAPDSNTDKHQVLREKPLAEAYTRSRGAFEKQEALRQKMEDAVDIEGRRVEEIGNSMSKDRRNSIQHINKRTNKINKKLQRRKSLSNKKKNNREKSIRERSRGVFFKRLKNRKTQKFVNKNASKRRVIVPVKRKKLEKLMLYYYVTEKMKNGELPVHSLEKFFEKIDGYSDGSPEKKKEAEKEPDLESLIKTVEESTKKDSDAKAKSEETSSLNSLTSIIDTIKKSSEDTSSEAKSDDQEETKKPDLDSFIRLLDKKLKSNAADSDEDSTTAPINADLKSLVGDENLAKMIGAESMISASNDDAEDAAELHDMEEQKAVAKVDKRPNSEAEITTNQVQKMLKSIAEINATLLDHGKQKRRHKKEHKKTKQCKGDNCVGREIIALLDKALHEVKTEKSTLNAHKSVEKSSQDVKVTGESRSKSDPYAGIGFAMNQEGTGSRDATEPMSQGNHVVPGTSRHIDTHGSDIIGTSQPARNRMVHGHHHDDDDDDDDDDDEDEDDDEDDHDAHHAYHYPLPIHDDIHPVHHQLHHLEHEAEAYHHHGYHGNQLDIKPNHHHDHDELGFTPPLNVDTAPMHHYPNRHIHDHMDIDSMLRGHPYPHHHHTPEVSLEGPISLAPVYQDMHHMLNGPGIHDQTDVHYEVEMHAHPDHHYYDHHDDDHHEYYHHGDDHHDDDHFDRGHHFDDDYHHTGYHLEEGYHHDDNDHHHDGDDDHHGEDEHDDYNHGDDHEHGENGEKKQLIMQAKRKSTWKVRKAKPNSKDIKKKSSKKPKRSTREDDDDDDDEIENVPRNGYGVSRLSYLTEQNGETMEHEIGKRIEDVEDVGRSIEDSVQHGVDRVTELSNSEVEAPDYDSNGHMEPNIHREDMHDEDD